MAGLNKKYNSISIWMSAVMLLAFQSSFIAANAQGISVSAPSHVQTGENFRVEYQIDTQDVSDFQSGLRNNDLVEIIAGPSTSRRSSIQMVNGHINNSSSITYTYILYAQKNGTLTLPSAHARVGSKTLSSKPVRVTISGSSAHSNGAPQMHQDNHEPQMRPSGSPISGNDLFIKVSANKQRVYEQEPILLTYKVYTLVDLIQLEGKMPDLTGFHTQEVELPQQKSFHMESLNGKNYKCVTWSQYVMYPQMTGKLEIPSITFKGTVVQRNRAVDPFEAFFNGGSDYTEVKRDIKAPGITVQVDPLPERPKDFSGGVGRFKISTQVDHQNVKAGDPLNLRVTIAGTGNLKLLKQPVLNLPGDFDKYDPKVTDNTKLTLNGVEGNMVYDFLIVPRNKGSYTLPPVEMNYYDTESNSYKTIKSAPIKIEVAQGNGKGYSPDADAERDKDIHPIKSDDDVKLLSSSYFFASGLYWTVLAALFVVFIVLLSVFWRRAALNADLVKLKGRRANKVATKRLKKASKLMNSGNQSSFYDEVLRALWGYMGDKLNIPVEQLSQENMKAQLAEHQVNEATTNEFISALDECEFERYAPGDPKGNMSKTFESARSAIIKIEETMKKASKRKGHSSMAKLLIMFAMLWVFFSTTTTAAVTKSEADSMYMHGSYQQAVKAYESLLKSGKNAAIYYNLGNAHYRSGNHVQAILAYERALRLSPGDDDIRFNLQFAQRKLVDKVPQASEMFFISAWRSLTSIFAVDTWAILAICSLALTLLLLLLFLFGSAVWMRKTGFFGAIVFLLVFLLCNMFAWQQRRRLENTSEAIVVSTEVQVKKTPSASSNNEFLIHEGTKVDILDKAMKDWRMIRLADGREGWVKTIQLEDI